MAPNAATPAGETPHRKTLEDIRRELDAEFPASPGSDGRAGVDHDDVERVVAPPRSVPVQHPGPATVGATPWRGYVIAGIIGCIIGQFLILASFAATRYGDDITRVWAVASASRPSAPVPQADDTAAPPASPSPAASVPEAAPSHAVPAEADEPPTIAPPATVAASLGVEPKEASTARRPDVQRPPSPPPAPRRPLAGPGDWVESQALLRSALSEWLVLSGRSDVEARVADAEVVLGADGSTAKTRVPVTSRGAVVLREQRWELGPGGWIIVDDREIERRAR